MGTNFYWYSPDAPVDEYTLDPEIHIGKRSAAGGFCSNCKITLCKEGTQAIHRGSASWHKECPRCKSTDSVEATCSFTITSPIHIKEMLAIPHEDPVVIDENGKLYSAKELLAMYYSIPIIFQDWSEFS